MDEPALIYCTLPRAARELYMCVGELLLNSTCVTLFPFTGRIEWVITHHIIWNHTALELIRTEAEDAGMPSCVSAIRPHVKNHNQLYHKFECSNKLLLCFTVIVYNFFLNQMLRHYGGRAMSPQSCMAETCSSTTREELPTSCATRKLALLLGACRHSADAWP
jgi:hypothetical protein